MARTREQGCGKRRMSSRLMIVHRQRARVEETHGGEGKASKLVWSKVAGPLVVWGMRAAHIHSHPTLSDIDTKMTRSKYGCCQKAH